MHHCALRALSGRECFAGIGKSPGATRSLLNFGQITLEEEIKEGSDYRDRAEASDFVPSWRDGSSDDVRSELES